MFNFYKLRKHICRKNSIKKYSDFFTIMWVILHENYFKISEAPLQLLRAGIIR